MHDPEGKLLSRPVPAAILPSDFKACTVAMDCFHGHAIVSEHGHDCSTFVRTPEGEKKLATKLFQVILLEH